MIPFMIANTINTRRSARSYQMKALATEDMQELQKFCASLDLPFTHDVDIRFFKAEPTNVLYITMKSPPDNVAFLTETDTVSISKAGFIGELLILFAESRGIASCWYGHYKLSELEKLMPHLDNPSQLNESNMGYGYSKGVTEGRRAICISPLGYYEDKGLRLMDRITKTTISFKRKKLKDLLENPSDLSCISTDQLYALDLARKAPSAANSQMWRFGFENDFSTIRVAMPVGYRHFKWEHPNVDIGICASHIWLGLIDKGHKPKVKITEELNRAVWKITL